MSENDIVSDIIQRLADRLGSDVLPLELQQSIESEIRHTWSGNQVYVSAINRPDRNADILQAYRRGQSIDALACRYSVTPRRIRQIINRRK